jgi:FAD/FMN-containing dehydrogenase
MAYQNLRRQRREARTAAASASRREAARRGGIDPHAVAEMERLFHGRLVWPGDPAYQDSRKLYNPAFEGHPQLVAYCDTQGDVRLCLRLAHHSGLPVTCRAGGHSTAGYSVNNGIVIDVSDMKDVHVDYRREQATVGAGTRFGRLNSRLDDYQLHVPGGVCEDVAVGGYAQGGGWSMTSREFGMNCDNILSVRVMLWDGHVVEADATKNADLYWAIRGGTGNNFGVLLDITYRLHRYESGWGFGLRWSLDDAPAALLQIQAHGTASDGPSKLGYLAFMAPRGVGWPRDASGRGEAWLMMRGLYHGSREEGMRALAPLLATPGVTLEIDQVDTYRKLNHLVVDGKPPEAPGVVFEVPDPWKEDKQSGFVDKPLDLADWKTVVEFYRTSPGPFNVAVIEPCGGAINAYPVRDSAFIHRHALFDFFVDVFWYEDADRAAQMRWLDDYTRLMARYANGHCYQNYPRATLTNFRWMYWGDAFDDLLWVKQKYDPRNFFRFEQSISPYPQGTRPPQHRPSPPRFSDRSIVYEPYGHPVVTPS